MTWKLEGDLDILKMYLHTENEVAMLRHSKLLIDDICTTNEKNTKIALRVKGHQPPWGIYIPSYNNFCSVV